MSMHKIGRQGIITAKELKDKIENENPFLLDIREKEDHDKAKIEDTLHSKWEDVADLIEKDELPKDRIIAVICYNGQSSMQVSTVLNIQGYTALSLLDGMEGWEKEGFKTIKGKS